MEYKCYKKGRNSAFKEDFMENELLPNQDVSSYNEYIGTNRNKYVVSFSNPYTYVE